MATKEFALVLHSDASAQGMTALELPPDWREFPSSLFDTCKGLLNGGMVEFVRVLVGGRPAHMVVDEEGQLKDLALNAAATGIYWAASLANGRGIPRNTIVGTAILFPGDFE